MQLYQKKQLIRQLKPLQPRLSFYRMIRNREFDELCRYYAAGIGKLTPEHFAGLVGQLERSFAAAPQLEAESPLEIHS